MGKETEAGRRYRGDFVAWAGGSMLIGAGGGGQVALHSHYAIQLVLAGPTGLRVRAGDADWTACPGALIASRLPHTIDVGECAWAVVLFVEPETPQGRALSSRLDGGIEWLSADRAASAGARLLDAWQVEANAASVQQVAQSVVEELSGRPAPTPSDARILRAVEHVRGHIDEPVRLSEVAAVACLSPSRFRHLFVAETGMPLRTYVLWRRLLRVWELSMAGESLSEAAHLAGFADSAHLSRTARAMFGLPPSALQMSGPLRGVQRGARGGARAASSIR